MNAAQELLSAEEMERERLLDRCKELVDDMSKSKELRRAAFKLMAVLISERPPERVRQLERERFGRSF